MANIVRTEKEISLEEEIIDLLKNPSDTRDIMEIPLQFISEKYDGKKIAELAKESGLQNKVGYLADFSLLLLERHKGKLKDYIEKRMGEIRENLQYISHELWKCKKNEKGCLDEELGPYIENAPESLRISYSDKHPQNKEFCKNLEKKWKVIGVFGVEEMYDYMRFLMQESRKTNQNT